MDDGAFSVETRTRTIVSKSRWRREHNDKRRRNIAISKCDAPNIIQFYRMHNVKHAQEETNVREA